MGRPVRSELSVFTAGYLWEASDKPLLPNIWGTSTAPLGDGGTVSNDRPGGRRRSPPETDQTPESL